MSEFQSFTIGTLNDVLLAYAIIQDVIQSFVVMLKGFIPCFTRCYQNQVILSVKILIEVKLAAWL